MPAVRTGARLWRLPRTLAFWAALAVFLFFVLFPIYSIVKSALSTPEQVFTIPPTYLPRLTLANFATLARQIPLVDYTRNSIVFALATGLVTAAVSFLAAYAFARYDVPGKDLLLVLLVLSTALPEMITVIPLFQVLKALKLLDSIRGLTLLLTSVLAPFTVWTLVAFMKQIPRELEEAAAIDGANLLQTLWKVVTPMLMPALATMFVVNFINSWNNFTYPLVFSSSPAAKTLSVAVTELFQARSPYGRPWELISTLGVVMIIPSFIITFVAQRSVVAGLTRGAIK